MKSGIVLRTAFVIAVVVAALWLSVAASTNVLIQQLVRDFGYLGVFVASVISGFNLIAPVPIISFVPAFTEAGFLLAPTVLLISSGLTVGDTLGFLIGRLGRDIESEKIAKRVARLEELRAKGRWLPLVALFFYAAFVPMPNEVIVIPLALAGYRFLQIIPITLAGNLLFNFLFAYGLLELAQQLF